MDLSSINFLISSPFSQTTTPNGTKLIKIVTWMILNILYNFHSIFGNSTWLLGPIMLSDIKKIFIRNQICDEIVTWKEYSLNYPI